MIHNDGTQNGTPLIFVDNFIYVCLCHIQSTPYCITEQMKTETKEIKIQNISQGMRGLCEAVVQDDFVF